MQRLKAGAKKVTDRKKKEAAVLKGLQELLAGLDEDEEDEEDDEDDSSEEGLFAKLQQIVHQAQEGKLRQGGLLNELEKLVGSAGGEDRARGRTPSRTRKETKDSYVWTPSRSRSRSTRSAAGTGGASSSARPLTWADRANRADLPSSKGLFAKSASQPPWQQVKGRRWPKRTESEEEKEKEEKKPKRLAKGR
jgi:hypothetical protein